MTRSRVSPDGRIAQRDVASKLVIIMVGLPARGKSYITKKIARYLGWQQHNTKVFNVGNRRRVAAGTATGPLDSPPRSPPTSPKAKRVDLVRTDSLTGVVNSSDHSDQAREAAHILLNIPEKDKIVETLESAAKGDGATEATCATSQHLPDLESMEQTAEFFDPKNQKAAHIREELAMATLDELLDYLLNQNGSVGILDATNSTVHRRALLYDHIKAKEPKLGILFIESICENPDVSTPPWI